MIQGVINFTYNTHINKILDITLYNNDDLIKTIEDIHHYERGEWKNNQTKRTDFVIMNFHKDAIPPELKTIISLFIDKDNRIQSKYKVKITEKTDNQVKIKTGIKLINKFANLIFKLLRFKIKINVKMMNKLVNLIFKLLRFKVYITFDYNSDNNKTSVQVIYKLKTKLPNSFNTYFNNVIENSFKPNYVYKIDEFIKNEVK